MNRRIWLACAATTFAVSTLLAQPSVVHTRDGNTYEGEVSYRGNDVVVNIHGVETVLPRDQVQSVAPAEDPDKQYRDRLAQLDAKDVAGRVALSKDAFENGRYVFARDTLEQTLQLEPNSQQASQLLETVQSQLRLEQQKPAATAPVSDRSPQPPQVAIDRHVLSPADIDTIRRDELKPTDVGVRIRFDGDVKKKFALSQNIPYDQFTAQPVAVQAVQILSGQDATLRDQIHLTTDPASMLMYRRDIQPFILQSCATSNCHGGPAGGSLQLITNADPDALAYTNFYILQMHNIKPPEESKDNGVFGSSQRGLIERGHGNESLLVNYALPPAIAKYDHPQINGKPITPVFRNFDDPRAKLVITWMDSALIQTLPSYGIHYKPPATSQPASAPGR